MNLSFNMLNQAMLTQVLHELRLGNLQRCKALGLSEDDIFMLQSLPPTTLSRLAHATVPWLEVKIDSPVLHRLIEQAERDEQNEQINLMSSLLRNLVNNQTSTASKSEVLAHE